MNGVSKILAIYLAVFLVLNFGAFFIQRGTGAIFDYEQYQTMDFSSVLESGANVTTACDNPLIDSYDEMICDAIANGSNPANIIDKFTFANTDNNGNKNLKNLGIMFLFILGIIFSFPIVLTRKSLTYKALVLGIFGVIFMGLGSFATFSMNWFFSNDTSGGPGYMLIALVWIFLAILLLIEILCLAIYIWRKNKNLKSLTDKTGV